MPTWLLFLATAVAVIVAGARLARDGDVIASRSKMGATWVGAILVAGATSLPEISTDLAAVRQGDVDLAIGDLFGSSMSNMLILAIADLFTRQRRLLAGAGTEVAVAAALAVSLTAIASVGILSDDNLTVLGIGWSPLVIAVGYVLGMRLLHQ
ncbi:MAG: sodium:calcium antiporter, partial [Vicinamibacterales bacterium]